MDVAVPPSTAAPFGVLDDTALELTARFVEYYNNWPHQSLHGQSPVNAFENRKIPDGESHQDDD